MSKKLSTAALVGLMAASTLTAMPAMAGGEHMENSGKKSFYEPVRDTVVCWGNCGWREEYRDEYRTRRYYTTTNYTDPAGKNACSGKNGCDGKHYKHRR